MSKTKKTMYEILEVSPDASDSELQAAHQRLTQQLQSEKNDINREETEFKLRVVNVAFNTLSVKRTRDAYDARLAALNAPAGVAPSLSLIPVGPKVETSSLKAEAMSLKAEAMSLKAEAVSLRADVMALKGDTGGETPSISALKKFSNLLAPVRGALSIIGSLIAMGIVVQVLFLLLANRHAVKSAEEVSKAEEKVLLQDYYQQTGVRVSSRAEMEALEQVNRRERDVKAREELAKRAQQEQERAKEREYDRFVEESRQIGDQVSANLRREEERARYEEEQRNRELERQQEWEKLRQEEMERQRVEAEMDRYRRINEDFREKASPENAASSSD